MKMYSGKDVQCIVELFLAEHFNFLDVNLSEDSERKLEELCRPYGVEVENIVGNN